MDRKMIKPHIFNDYDLNQLIFLEARESNSSENRKVNYEDNSQKFKNLGDNFNLVPVSFSNKITYLKEETLSELKDKFGEFKTKDGVTILNNLANKFVSNWYDTIMEKLNLNVADKNCDNVLTLNEFIDTKNLIIGYDAKNEKFLLVKPKDLMSKEELTYFENQYEVITNIHALLDEHLTLDKNKDGKITAKELQDGTNVPVKEIVEQGIQNSNIQDKVEYLKKLKKGGSKKSLIEKRKEAILTQIKELKKMLVKLDKRTASIPSKGSIDKATQTEVALNSANILALRKKYGSQNIDKLSSAIENSKKPIEQKAQIEDRVNVSIGKKDYENLVSIVGDAQMSTSNTKMQMDIGSLTNTFSVSANDPQTAKSQIKTQIGELYMELVKIDESQSK